MIFQGRGAHQESKGSEDGVRQGGGVETGNHVRRWSLDQIGMVGMGRD